MNGGCVKYNQNCKNRSSCDEHSQQCGRQEEAEAAKGSTSVILVIMITVFVPVILGGIICVCCLRNKTCRRINDYVAQVFIFFFSNSSHNIKISAGKKFQNIFFYFGSRRISYSNSFIEPCLSSNPNKFIHYLSMYLKTARWVANSVAPNQTPQHVAFDQSLHCFLILLRPACPKT